MNAAVLFSGGKDSTMALYYALEMKEDVIASNQRIACVIDIRNGENNTELFDLVAKLQKDDIAKVIFLDADEKVILDRVETVVKEFKEAGVECEKLTDSEIIRMYNLFTNPAYTAYERTDNVYLSFSQIIAQNNI